jgi:type I restriction enzyme, S subunit
VIGSTLARLRVIDDHISPHFLARYLKSKFKDIRSHCTGATIPHVSANYLSRILVPMPDKNEQKELIELFSRIETIKQKRQEAIAKLDELLKSIFFDMFGDPVYWDRYSTEKISKYIYKVENENPNKMKGKKYTYIDISSVNNKTKTIEITKSINHENAPSRARQLLRDDDVIVSTVRPNLNAVSIIGNLYENPIGSTGFCVLRADRTRLNPVYLFSIVKTKYFINSLMKVAKGANYPAVSDFDVKNIGIIIPPIEIQNQYEGIFINIKKQKEIMEKSLSEIENLFNSTMQKAFREKLD